MFDTLRHAKILKAAGIAPEVAEAHVTLLACIVEEKMVTKRDLKELEYRLMIKMAAIAWLAMLAILISVLVLKAKG